MNRSWKTTLCGLLGIIGSTVPMFFPEYLKLGSCLAAIASSAGLLFARDNDKTSEEVGAKQRISQLPLLGLLLFTVCLCGCINTSKLAKELAKDNATVSFKVTTIYGTGTFFRAMPGTNTLTVSPDGTITQGKK